jgi:hypothetical protein
MPDMNMEDMEMHDSDVGVHGMLVVGEGPIYVSHLPMFMRPHNFQVILQVTFSSQGSDPQDLYVRDRRDSLEKVYTFSPDPFPISALAPNDPDVAPLASFSGELFRGHFERGGTSLAKDVVATVEEVLYFRELDLGAKGSESEPLTYLCFGNSHEAFLAHMITMRPSFDQVMRVGFLDPELRAMEFPRAVPVIVRTGGAPAKHGAEERIRDGDRVSANFFQSIGPKGQHGFQAELEVKEELYLEIKELR